MSGNYKLTREQVVCLAFIGIIGNIVYSYTWISDDTDRAAWVACFLGILLVIPLTMWIFCLGGFFPGSTLFDILEAGLGKFTGLVAGVVYIAVNMAEAVAQLNIFTEMLNVFFLQYTPPWVIMLILSITAAMFAYGEIKTFARWVEILTILAIVNYFAPFVMAFPKLFNIRYVIPVFDTPWTGFVKGTLFMAGGASECLLFFMVLLRYIPDSNRRYRWIVVGIASSAVVFSAAILIIIGIMSPELAKRIAFGGINVSRFIQIGTYAQGLELFVLATYQVIAVSKTALCIYCIWTVMKSFFKQKHPLLHLFATAILIYVPTVWLSSYNKAYFLTAMTESYVVLPFSICVLLLASLSVRIKNNGKGSAGG